MEKEEIKNLTGTFESFVNTMDNGIEFWFARDLQHLLGYTKWDNFLNTISKAKTAVESSNEDISNHFADVSKTIQMPKGAKKEIPDIMLTRYACYLITMNGDTTKSEIAFAQQYFAIQTRKQELVEQKMLDFERLNARKKLTTTEKEFQELAYERGVDGVGIGRIRSKGDTVLFGGKTTGEMKKKLGVKSGPLADFLPTVTIKAKDLATEVTNHNMKHKGLYGENQITYEHIKNNVGVRKYLEESGIKPEDLPAEEDLKKIERKIKNGVKNLSKK